MLMVRKRLHDLKILHINSPENDHSKQSYCIKCNRWLLEWLHLIKINADSKHLWIKLSLLALFAVSTNKNNCHFSCRRLLTIQYHFAAQGLLKRLTDRNFKWVVYWWNVDSTPDLDHLVSYTTCLPSPCSGQIHKLSYLPAVGSMSSPSSSYSLFNRARYFFISSEVFPFFILATWRIESIL